MSILQNWVEKLPLRQQGVLLLALRGPDGFPKEDAAKPLVRALRALVLNAGKTGAPMIKGEHWPNDPFMSRLYIDDGYHWNNVCAQFFSSIDQYPLHFFQHLIHAFQVAGYGHPEKEIRGRCLYFYQKACSALHLSPEFQSEMAHRLRDGERD